MSILKQHYDIEEDWNGELYCGITLNWNCAEGYVDIAVPNYLQKQLVKYSHNAPTRPQYCPYEQVTVQYGQNYKKYQSKKKAN